MNSRRWGCFRCALEARFVPPALRDDVLIFVIFYFLLIRPQQRRMKQHQAMIGAVKKNDVVVTGGGLVGKVTRVDEAEVESSSRPTSA
jgi:preprotein translocase YajC subunit